MSGFDVAGSDHRLDLRQVHVGNVDHLDAGSLLEGLEIVFLLGGLPRAAPAREDDRFLRGRRACPSNKS